MISLAGADLHNTRLFIDGDTFGRCDIAGREFRFARADLARVEATRRRAWFVDGLGHVMFQIHRTQWDPQALDAFVARLGVPHELT